jgi:hypothetical protein
VIHPNKDQNQRLVKKTKTDQNQKLLMVVILPYVPGFNIGTDVISPGEGGSDDKIDGSTILPSNPPSTRKLLMYQKYLESKQKQEEEKKKKNEKKK